MIQSGKEEQPLQEGLSYLNNLNSTSLVVAARFSLHYQSLNLIL